MDCAATSALAEVFRSFVARKIRVWLGANCGWNDAVCAPPLAGNNLPESLRPRNIIHREASSVQNSSFNIS